MYKIYIDITLINSYQCRQHVTLYSKIIQITIKWIIHFLWSLCNCTICISIVAMSITMNPWGKNSIPTIWLAGYWMIASKELTLNVSLDEAFLFPATQKNESFHQSISWKNGGCGQIQLKNWDLGEMKNYNVFD